MNADMTIRVSELEGTLPELERAQGLLTIAPASIGGSLSSRSHHTPV
jgi:hypothetical protein